MDTVPSGTTFRTVLRGRGPAELLSYLAFALAVSVAWLTLVFVAPKSLSEPVLPFVGIVGAMPYLFSIWPAWQLCLRPTRRAHRQVTILLALAIIFGLVDLMMFGSTRQSDNPYLRLSRWRFLWELGVPSFWISIMLSPRVTRLVELEQPSKLERSQTPSLAQAVTIVCIALAFVALEGLDHYWMLTHGQYPACHGWYCVWQWARVPIIGLLLWAGLRRAAIGRRHGDR